jgi:2,3-bisphosphoglycerate-dependent phosphoglycerate mutase
MATNGETELYIVRHGEAVCNVRGVAGGAMGCTGLTARGRAQMELVAKWLANQAEDRPFNSLWTSPRPRAREGAEILSGLLGLPLVVLPGLRGPDYGAGDGVSWRALREHFGGSQWHKPDEPIAERAETWSEFLQRTTEAALELIAMSQGRRGVLVGHSETLTLLPAVLREGSLAKTTGIPYLEHAAVTYLCRSSGQSWVEKRFSLAEIQEELIRL